MIVASWAKVVDEAVSWLVPAVLGGVVWLIRRAGQLVRNVERLGQKVDDLTHYCRHHLGPNGDARPVHRRLDAIEEAHGLEVGP